MTSEILAEAERKMLRAVEAMERDFHGLRTGRASTALVERLHVDYYGTPTPLNQLASISVPEPHQVVIQPWDRGVLGAIAFSIAPARRRGSLIGTMNPVFPSSMARWAPGTAVQMAGTPMAPASTGMRANPSW